MCQVYTPTTCQCQSASGHADQKSSASQEKYQTHLYEAQEIKDKDLQRPLTREERRLVHNCWMHDIEEWMDEFCYKEYKDHIEGRHDGEKIHGRTPRQHARHLKKTRFNKVLNDLGLHKDFVLAIVQHSDTWTAESVRDIHSVLCSLETRSLNQ